MNAHVTARIDLASAPFHLGPEQVRWVESTLMSLSDRQKVGQIMCPYLRSGDAQTWIEGLVTRGIEPGATMLTSRPRHTARQDVSLLQSWSQVPLLVAGNLEAGAGNFLEGEDSFANPMQVAATRDSEQARRLAIHCARIANDVGLNWAFAPVVDVALNPHNPITNTRTFGDDADLVGQLSSVFVQELESRSVATSVKHFPGDGVDSRDQHLHATVNDLSIEEWDDTYGRVYRRVFSAGTRTVMIGHIRLPAFSRALVEGIEAVDILPATLAPEITTGLLRDRLGFNGLVITDNSAMAGMTTILTREEALPRAIMAGSDMLLGNVDLETDFNILIAALDDGRLSRKRLDDAVRRVLALKSSLGLSTSVHRPGGESTRKGEEAKWQRELAEASVTLVKDTQSLLPLTKQQHRRVLVYVLGDVPTFYDPSGPLAEHFSSRLKERGLEVTLRHIPEEGRDAAEAAKLHEIFDLCIYFANLRFAGNSNHLRVSWSLVQAPDAPRHVTTLPTALVSVADPYLLQDMPMIRTAINGYTPTVATVDACIRVLFGDFPPRGQSPVDPFAGRWDAAL